MTRMTERIFTPQEVVHINERQMESEIAIHICPNVGDDQHEYFGETHGGLVATVYGWKCLFCDFTDKCPAHDWYKQPRIVPLNPNVYESQIVYPLEFDEDGYPTDESLISFKNFPVSDGTGLRQVSQALLDMGRMFSLTSFDTSFQVSSKLGDGAEAYLINLSSGGWSGNETLIDVIMEWPFVKELLFTGWKKGGNYEFMVYKHFVE